MDTNIDWGQFHRLETATILEFFSSAAAAYLETGAIGQKECDALRISLSQISRGERGINPGPVTLLVREQNEFLITLVSRFGPVGVSLLLFRSTLQPHLLQMRDVLSDFGQQLLEKVRLNFNRPFYVYFGGTCQRRTLASSVFMEVSETLSGAVNDLDEILKAIRMMVPSDLSYPSEEDEELDRNLARHWGFSGIRQEAIPFRTEHLVRRRLSGLLFSLTDILQEVTLQIQYNHVQERTGQFALITDWLKAEGMRLANLSYPGSGDLESWELRRSNFNSSIAILNQTLVRLQEEFLLLASAPLSGQGMAVAFPGDIVRKVTTHLISTGVDVAGARQATDKLVAYCSKENIGPSAILEEELSQIDPALTNESLMLLKEAEQAQSLGQTHHKEKQRILAGLVKLSEMFKKTLKTQGTTLLAVLAVLTGIGGCGIKTAPKSDLEDFRPELPFRTGAARPNPPSADQAGKKITPVKNPEDTPLKGVQQ